MVDALDQAIIAILRDDGRASLRSIGERVGVTPTTVQARIRRLEAARLLRVVAICDMGAFGHDLLAFAAIELDDPSGDAVAAEVVARPEAIAVIRTSGAADLMVGVLARDRAHLAELMEWLPGRRGVVSARWQLAVDVLAYRAAFAAVDVEPAPFELPVRTDRVDELDLRIVGELLEDARRSNRAIADRIGVSEATVRARVRRLGEERIIHIGAVTDVRAAGIGAYAYLLVTVAGRGAAAVAAAIAGLPGAAAVARTLGSHDVLVVLTAPSEGDLAGAVEQEVAAIDGVAGVEVHVAGRAFKHAYTWARLAV